MTIQFFGLVVGLDYLTEFETDPIVISSAVITLVSGIISGFTYAHNVEQTGKR